MHAITIKQPWAYAICHLGKRIENRTWKPSEKLIGQRVAIHAGSTTDYDAFAWMGERGLTRDVTHDALPACQALGAVVATALLVGYAEETKSGRPVVMGGAHRIAEAFTHEQIRLWWMGPIGHVLADLRVLATPIPCKGQLGYWRLPADVEAEVLRQEASDG